jgi:endonuclease IV
MSPNHQAFIVWTVHLQHEGKMLAFLLDVIEVPEVRFPICHCTFLLLMLFKSHTGIVMANAFQDMLERFELQEKVKLYLYVHLSDTKYQYLDSLDDHQQCQLK